MQSRPKARGRKEGKMRDILQKQLDDSWYLRKPMKEIEEDGAEARWLKKPVEKTRKISLVDGDATLRMEGPGHMGVDPNFGVDEEGSVYLDFATEQPVINPVGRAYTESMLFVPFDHENLEEYNRLSFWVYADAPGSAASYMTIQWHNAGPKVMPVPGRFEGSHSAMVGPGKWTRVVWEMPNVARNDTTAIAITALAYGTSMPAPSRIRIFIADLRLEKVDADHYKGFSMRKDSIAYCHSGYRNQAAKQALIQFPIKTFLIQDEEGNTVYTGEPAAQKDGFYVLDFSELVQEGWYIIRAGEVCSKPFPIGGEAYLSAAWKALNFFFTERCGFDVPCIHTECHKDIMSVHPDGRKKSVAGGWHDAGDLTQDSCNTAECALAMLELAEAAMEKEVQLGRRALEEARWGIDWLLNCRWRDGYTHCGRIIGFWTKNVIGDQDDMEAAAENRAFNNLLTAGVFARAYLAFEKEDPMYAQVCAQCAKEDYFFGVDGMHNRSGHTQVEMNAMALWAAAELYGAFGGREYLEDAALFARIVMRCQQQDVPDSFRILLRGYFYEDEKHTRTQAYFHRAYDHVPLEGLAKLLAEAPEHKDAPKWKRCLELYAEYLERIFEVTPYGVLPAGIYELDNTDYSGIYQEGDGSQGEPTMQEYNEEVKNGICLDASHYLRVFPVAYQFRGFFAPILSKAIAAVRIAEVLPQNKGLISIAVRQMEWILGYNPFAVSGMYGEGYDYHPLYSGLEPQLVGALPVGFETYENEDEPYYPVQNLPTYKEIWVHTTGRMIRMIAALGF